MPNPIVSEKAFFPLTCCVAGITLAGCSCSAPQETRKVRNTADVMCAYIHIYICICIPFYTHQDYKTWGILPNSLKQNLFTSSKTKLQVISPSGAEQGLQPHPCLTQSNLLSSLAHCNTFDIGKTLS